MDSNDIQTLLDLSSAGSVDATISLYDYYLNCKEYTKAFEILVRLHLSNDININKRLAFAYENGIGTEKNINKALEHYKIAFDNGDPSSGFNIALYYYNKKEYEKCLSYLLLTSATNHVQSLKMLAEFYSNGIVVVRDLEIANNIYHKLISLGDKNSLYCLGKNLFIMKKYDEAFKYLESAYEIKDYRSTALLADCFLGGFGVEQSIVKTIELLNFGLKNSDYNCIVKLSRLYENGIGVEKDLNRANGLMEMAKNIRMVQANKK